MSELFEEVKTILKQKEEQYGNAWLDSAEFLAMLFPDLPKEELALIGLLGRMWDKLARLKQEPYNDDTWMDIAGYALRGLELARLKRK